MISDRTSLSEATGKGRHVSLNKNQKKQIDALKNKLQRAQQLLSAARNQPDDPEDVPRLERDVAQLQAEIDKVKKG